MDVAPTKTVVVTGVGVVLPGVYDRNAFHARVARGDAVRVPLDFPRVESIASARRMRRMSDYVKLTLAAATLAARDAFGDSGAPPGTAALLGTTHGSAGFSETYYRQLIEGGVAAANPSLFAEGVPNAAAAQLSLMMKLTGPCQTLVGTHTAGLDALRLALLRVAGGEWERAIVSAGEEDSPTVAAAYAHCTGRAADATAGAAALVIESVDAAAARGATVLATLTHAATASDARANATGDGDAEPTAGPTVVGPLVRVLRALPPADRFVHTGGRAESIAFRRAERGESTVDLSAALGGRFSLSPLAAIIAAIDGDAGAWIIAAADPSGLAVGVRGRTH